MSKWENFSLGFTYLSPVVGVYTLFATSFVAGGPPMWWNYILVGLGQLMVCLIFGEIVSQFPISGRPVSLGAASRRQALGVDGRVGLWLGAVLHHGGRRLRRRAVSRAAVRAREHAARDHRDRPRPHRHAPRLLNLSGTRLLARVAMFGFICELVGAIVVGGYLLLFARHQPLKVLVDTSFVHTRGTLLAGVSRLLARRDVLLLRLRGLRRRRRGDAGREPHDPEGHAHDDLHRRRRGRCWVCLAFVLSISDIGAVMSGKDTDPIVTLLKAAMGEVGFRAVIVVVLVSFISCLLESAGRRQPAGLRLRARSDDLRQQILEPHVAGPPCAGQRAHHDGRDPGG